MRPRIQNSSSARRAQAWRRRAATALRAAAICVGLALPLAALARPAAAQNVTVSGTTFPAGTAKQTVTLTVHTDDIVIQSLATTSGNGNAEFFIYDYGTCAVGTYVSAGTSCTFTLAFSPQTAGYAQSPSPIGRWAQLNLGYTDQVYNAPVFPNFPLTGSASIPTPVVSPGTIADLVGNDTLNTLGFAGDNGPASGAVFSQPTGIAMDNNNLYHPYGNIYIADTNNAVVRVFYQSGNVPPLNNPVQGNMYTIAGVAPTGSIAHPGPGQDATIATQSHLNSPTGVAVSPLGDVYIADSFNNAIRVVKAYTAGYIFTVAGTLNAPGSFGGDGGPATSANLSTPSGVSVDGYGNLYIADTNNNAIRVVYQGGTVLANLIATEIPGTTATVGYIYTLAGGPNNTPQTALGDGQLASLANLNAPAAAIVDSSGNVYIADSGNKALRRVDAVTGLISTLQIGVDEPYGLAVDAADNIYFVGQSTCTVWQYNPSMQTGLASPYVSVVAGNGICATSGDGGGATSASLNLPLGVVVDGLGNLYVLGLDGVRMVSAQQSNFNYGTVNISNGGVLSAVVTDDNILPAPGVQTVVDFSNPAFSIANATPQYFSIGSFVGVNTNIPDCNGVPPVYPYLSPGKSCGVQVAFQPDVDGGPFTGSAYQPGLNASVVPGIALAFTGSGTGTLPTATLAGPSTAFTAEANQGPSSPQIFDLTNTGSSTLRISNISVGNYVGNSGSFALSYNCPIVNSYYTVAPGATCEISVTFTATGSGPVSATLQVNDNASTGSGVQTAPLNGAAVAPQGVFTDTTGTLVSTVAFATATPGSSSTATVMLENIGTTTLNINTAAWSLSGTNPGAFSITSNTCAPSLAIGGSCSIGLKFSPPAFSYGNYSANLVVQDDSGGTPLNAGLPTYITQTLPLTGTTGNAPLQSSSFTLQNATFPAEPIGTPFTTNVTLLLNDASNVVSITTAAGSEFTVGSYAACSGPAGTTCAVPITFTPAGIGTRNGSLIVANLESGVPVPYFLPMTGTGTGTIAALTPGIISTVVGGNGYQTSAATGLDGPAAQAQIGPIGGFVMDSAGEMFLAGGNQTIFKVDTSRNIHLYAGTGAQNGMAGDGGPALNASLAYIGPIALDASGRLYLGDSDATQFDDPRRIRAIDPSTGLINTVVGYVPTFSWYPNFPYQTGMKVQINFGGVQYLFRAEPGGTSAGTDPIWPSTVGATVQDGSITWQNEGIYTATNGCTGQLDMLGDGCPAQDVLIGIVTGLTVDSYGNLYWAESGLQFDILQSMYQNQPATVEVEVPHSMIRRMDASTGIVTVVAGTGNETTYTMGYNVSSVGIPGYTGDHGLATAAEVNASALAFDSKGNLYFIQDGAYVRKIDLSTGIVTTVTGAAGTPSATNNQCAPVSPEGGSALTAQYTLLSGITFDAADNMYLADSNQCVVRRIDAATQTVHTVAGAPNAGVPYLNLGYGDFGQPISDGSALEAQLSIPSQVQLDSNANIYIASNYNGGVRKVDVSQSILPFAGPYLQQTYLQPTLTVSAPLTATVLNAGNSGTLQFASPFISPSWGINYDTFLRDVTDPTGTPDCYDLESIAPGNECPISADFAPQYSSTPNVVTAQIGVNDNAPNTPQTIQLTGISFGDPPAVTLTPALVSLFTPQGSSSAPQQLTLINNGTSPLPISAIAITGSGASAYSITSNTCGTELAAVSACYIYVKFSPPYLGTTTPPDNLKATLSVTDIAVNSPQISQLVGLGTAAVPIPLHIVETIDVSDAPTLSLASQLAILETIDVSDAAPSLSVAAQLNINEAISVSDAPIAVPQLTATTATIMVSSTAIPLGGAENITIQVTPTAATGTVNLYDGSALLGTGALLNGHFTYDTGNLTAGTHSLHASYLGSSTYAASSTGTALVQVQATLTITANNASRAFAAANPTLGYTVTGYTNGDTSAVLSGAPTLSTTAVTHSPAGSYPITVAPGTLTAPSYYNLSFVPGTLTITGNHSQTIYFLPFPTAISLSVKTLTLAATTSSALPITYQVSGPATLSGTNLTLTGPGTVTVTATQPGSPTFSPATSVAQTFIVVTP